MRPLANYIFLLFFLVSVCSCKKFVDVDLPINQVNSEFVFSNDQTATSSVLGLYSQVMLGSTTAAFLNGATTLYPGMSADELTITTPNPNSAAFINNSILPTSSIINSTFWQKPYQLLYQSNACLEGLNKSTGVSAALKQQLTGETHFLRALCYFYMTNLFGKVPLVISTSFEGNANLPRTSVDSIYAQITSDLVSATQELLPAYPSDGKVRTNKWAATALLARVYLYEQNWAKAEEAATEVIDQGGYSIESDLDAAFLANSAETILAFAPVQPTVNTSEGYLFVPPIAGLVPRWKLTDQLLSAFEAGDQRAIHWIGSTTVNAQTYFYPFKYKVYIGADDNAIEFNIVLRYAEQYLIRAEARTQQNNFTGAAEDLNVLRTRAGLLATNANDQPTLLTAVLHERQTELFCEMGHRWMDLKRTGNADAILSVEKTGWTANAALYPIPFGQIQTNPFLDQNAGY